MHKGRLNQTFSLRNSELHIGKVGIVAAESGVLAPRHLNMILRSWKNYVKKAGTVTFNVHPAHSYTKKSLGTRMGKGKGSVQDYYCRLRSSQLICEFKTIMPYTNVLAWARKMKRKIPIATVLLSNAGTKKKCLVK